MLQPVEVDLRVSEFKDMKVIADLVFTENTVKEISLKIIK